MELGLQESTTDVSVIQSAMAGDQEALGALWRGHRRWVAAILLAHKPREADLEDLLQGVAMQVCRKMNEIRDPNAFRPWLRTVAVNVARGEGRKVTRRKHGMLRLAGARQANAQSSNAGVDEQACCEDAKRVLDAALELPEQYREPVLMRCLRHMSYKQISAVLELPETTIETRIARGRRMLREILALNERRAASECTSVVSTGGAP